MHLAATISEHPIVAHAVGECVGDIIERRGDSPDLLVLCISDRLIGATEDIAAASAALLQPAVMVGIPCNEMSVGQRSSIGNGGLGMLALWHTRPSSSSGQVAVEPEWQVRASERVRSVRLAPDADPAMPLGMSDLAGGSGTLLLFTDPLTLPPRKLAEQVGAVAPDLSVIVATPGSVRPRAGSALVLNGSVCHDGAVGVHFPADFPHRMLGSFGFAPVGPRFAIDPYSTPSFGEVTRITELAGRPAKQVLESVIEGLAPSERAAASMGLHLRWIGPPRAGVEIPRFASVLGTDGESVAVAGGPPEGATSIQFQIRDRESLDTDLHQLVACNAEMAGGLFFIVDRPERAGTSASVTPAPPSILDLDGHRTASDVIGSEAVIISEEVSRSDFMGIRCGEVLIVDRRDVVSADRAVTILGLVD